MQRLAQTIESVHLQFNAFNILLTSITLLQRTQVQGHTTSPTRPILLNHARPLPRFRQLIIRLERPSRILNRYNSSSSSSSTDTARTTLSTTPTVTQGVGCRAQSICGCIQGRSVRTWGSRLLHWRTRWWRWRGWCPLRRACHRRWWWCGR